MEVLQKILDPAENSTGGGSASAIAGAMAAALAAMVARLSIGKEGMQPADFYEAHNARLVRLADELLEGARLDSDAFAAVLAGFRLPKDTQEQKTARVAAIQNAWIQSTRIPLENAQRCSEAQELANELVGRSNTSAASDLTCALYLARAGGLGCLDNVTANLEMIKDERIAADLQAQALSTRERLDRYN
ncbi:MAG TPA: cyclodeaminase/cyclohydrolase family protein [Anaerolineales bacterium]|nr:cyclodeaminase/cyclohydrolase family protein [Anaerolineales bacterium]